MMRKALVRCVLVFVPYALGCGGEEAPTKAGRARAEGTPAPGAESPSAASSSPAATTPASTPPDVPPGNGTEVDAADADAAATAPANGYAPLVIPAGAVVYYVDAQAGDDQHDGKSETAAWKTLARVSSADVHDAEYVLFKRGQEHAGGVVPKGSGKPNRPITFGAYGAGTRPVIESDGSTYAGFELGSRAHFVIRDIEIRGHGGPGVHVDDATDVYVYNTIIAGTGSQGDMSAIHGNGAHYVHADHVTMIDVTGDAFGIWGGDHLRVTNSVIEKVFGGSADAVHIAWASDIEIRGNWMDLTGTNSGKGLMCICEDEHAVIADNVLIGGNYAVGVQGNDFLVENNWAEDNNHAPWSYTFAWGGQEGVPTQMFDYVARKNVIVRGVNAFAGFYNNVNGTKHNMQVYENVIVDSTVSFATWGADFVGSAMHDNTLVNTPEAGGPGLAVYANASTGGALNKMRPAKAGRGAF